MAEKTIPGLDPATTLTDNALLIIDSGIQTFKMTFANFVLSIRDSGLLLPSGAMTAYAGTSAPTGWLLADGSPVSRTTYARLFSAIGTAFGIGDGSTTFNLPDTRGRVIAGKDDMGGSPAGRMTSGVSGINGTVIGQAGGDQAYTPGGVNGGSQSIAHTHSTSNHTHTISHHHMWGLNDSSGVVWRTNFTGDSTSTAIGTAGANEFSQNAGITSGTNAFPMRQSNASANRPMYTTGALGAASGSGASATSGSNGGQTTSGMSANATVNGSNFTFAGTASHRVQPTLIANFIIKT